jgi:hypothetical protein
MQSFAEASAPVGFSAASAGAEYDFTAALFARGTPMSVSVGDFRFVLKRDFTNEVALRIALSEVMLREFGLDGINDDGTLNTDIVILDNGIRDKVILRLETLLGTVSDQALLMLNDALEIAMTSQILYVGGNTVHTKIMMREFRWLPFGWIEYEEYFKLSFNSDNDFEVVIMRPGTGPDRLVGGHIYHWNESRNSLIEITENNDAVFPRIFYSDTAHHRIMNTMTVYPLYAHLIGATVESLYDPILLEAFRGLIGRYHADMVRVSTIDKGVIFKS